MSTKGWKFPGAGPNYSECVYYGEVGDSVLYGNNLDHKYVTVDHWDGPIPYLTYWGCGVQQWKESPVSQALTSAWGTQVGGEHYTKQKIQTFEFSMANDLDPMQHTIVKYVARFRDKGGIEDLHKAKHVIDLLIEWEQKNANSQAAK